MIPQGPSQGDPTPYTLQGLTLPSAVNLKPDPEP